MFRFRSPQGIRPVPPNMGRRPDLRGIHFVDEAPVERPAPPQRPKAPEPPAPAATAAVAATPPTPPKKKREFPIGTIAFATVVGTGLLMAGKVGPFHASVRVEESMNRSFKVDDDSAVVVRTFNGPIEVARGETGKIECEAIKTASGGDEAEAAAEMRRVLVTMREEDGAIQVQALRNGPSANSAGVSIKVRVPDGCKVRLETSNGPIQVRGVEGSVEAITKNGRVDVQNAVGVVNLMSSNGTIVCRASEAIVQAETTNGSIDYRGSLAPGNHRLETSNGKVSVRLPEKQEFRLDARTSNGKVSCDFDLEDRKADKRSHQLVGFVGDNPATVLKIRSNNGSVSVREGED